MRHRVTLSKLWLSETGNVRNIVCVYAHVHARACVCLRAWLPTSSTSVPASNYSLLTNDIIITKLSGETSPCYIPVYSIET